jgi:hypothetical protein
MKKALAGCLIVALLALVVGGGALWYFVLRPGWNAASELVEAGKQWADLAQIDAQVENQGSFEPPADGRLAGDTLQRFLAVQQDLDARIGARLGTLEARYREIEAQQRASGRTPGVQDLLGAYGDLFGLLKEARQAQVEALNAQKLSLAEYRWARNQAYAALALTAMPQLPPGTDTTLAANAEALRPHRELLARTLATTWLDF